MEARALVRYRKDGSIGVVVDSPGKVYSPGEVAALWEGDLGGEANCFYEPSELEEVGREAPVADLGKCGCGQREKTCIFLTLSPAPTCQRFLFPHNALVEILKSGQSGAGRIPVDFSPKCQL